MRGDPKCLKCVRLDWALVQYIEEQNGATFTAQLENIIMRDRYRTGFDSLSNMTEKQGNKGVHPSGPMGVSSA